MSIVEQLVDDVEKVMEGETLLKLVKNAEMDNKQLNKMQKLINIKWKLNRISQQKKIYQE